MNPGDIITKNGHQYKIVGIHLGALGQESLAEIESISHSPGWTGQWEYHPRMFVPLHMLESSQATPHTKG